MRERYLSLMEKSLSAYTDEHIIRYFNDVKENGLKEHGFPRLTSNIGILISHGRRADLLPLFTDMMEFCCKTIPKVKAANDFSVREIICCLLEVEQSRIVPAEYTERWRSYLATIEPTKCYDKFATSPADKEKNWALFTALSEYFRQGAGLCNTNDFIELQLLQQLQWFDENGMYRDNAKHVCQQPIMYDMVPRGLYSLLLDQGYRGASYDAIDAALKKAGLLTLDMQSPNGEMPFGGRSNQFLLNEAWMVAIFEYEAKRYAREGNTELAAKFKAANDRAISVIELWLNKKPIRHIKNRFPTETKYGCEGYAYFDKYMITVASNLYAAYLICDESIPFERTPDHTACAARTTKFFHKLFLKSGGYGLEFDIDADPIHDANGLGRLHREGAPTAICMTCPCPAKPYYKVDIEETFAFSLCSAVQSDGGWSFGADESAKYEVYESGTADSSAFATLICNFANGRCVKEHYAVNGDGVSVTVEGEGEIGYSLPAFSFDGEVSPEITADEHSLTVTYDGWVCRYTTDGRILDLGRTAANRSGHYRAFIAKADNKIRIKIEISGL